MADLHYDVRGTGPVLLIVPGGAGHPMGLHGMTDHLADRFSVVTYDPLGLASQIRRQGLHRSAIVAELLGAGIHMGGKSRHGSLVTVAGLSDNHTIVPKMKASSWTHPTAATVTSA